MEFMGPRMPLGACLKSWKFTSGTGSFFSMPHKNRWRPGRMSIALTSNALIFKPFSSVRASVLLLECIFRSRMETNSGFLISTLIRNVSNALKFYLWLNLICVRSG